MRQHLPTPLSIGVTAILARLTEARPHGFFSKTEFAGIDRTPWCHPEK
jgi:hypothetical protein